MIVLERRIELMRPVNPAPIDHHDDLFLGGPEAGHDLVDILAELLGIEVRDNFIEDFGGAVLHRTDDAEEHPAGDAAPGAILQPGLTFEPFFAFDLTLAQGAQGEADALGRAPPARAGQRKAPQDCFVCIEQNDLATARLVLEGGQFKRTIREVSGVGIEAPGGAIVAYVLFFKTLRTLSRPSWTPVSRAKTVASSRQLHWEWTEPCSRGS